MVMLALGRAAADTDEASCPLLTSCCVTRFLIGHRLVGDPFCRRGLMGAVTLG